jgi:hypothetical protein
MKMIVYSVQIWDGADRHNHKFYLSSKAEAEKYVAKNTYERFSEVQLEIFDTIEEAEGAQVEKVRERALKKLTDEERRALGL